MNVKEYVELRFHFTGFIIESAGTGKKLLQVNQYPTKSQLRQLQGFYDCEVSAISPAYKKTNNEHIDLFIKLSIEERE